MKTEIVVNQGVEEIKRLCARHALSPMELSLYLHVTWTRIYEVISGKRRITPETDILLCKFFDLTPGYFAQRQLEYDLVVASRSLEEKLKTVPRVYDTLKA